MDTDGSFVVPDPRNEFAQFRTNHPIAKVFTLKLQQRYFGAMFSFQFWLFLLGKQLEIFVFGGKFSTYHTTEVIDVKLFGSFQCICCMIIVIDNLTVSTQINALVLACRSCGPHHNTVTTLLWNGRIYRLLNTSFKYQVSKRIQEEEKVRMCSCKRICREKRTWTTRISVTKSCFRSSFYSTRWASILRFVQQFSLSPLHANATRFCTGCPRSKSWPLTV